MTIATLLVLGLKISLILMVFALGLRASVQDATYLIRRPRELARAMVSMFVVMPVVVFALTRAFELHPAVRLALAGLALSPLPPTFPKKALKQGGRVSYTVGLLVAATVLAIVYIPLALELIERINGNPLRMTAGAVFALVFGALLVPLALGIAVHRFAPAFAERAAQPVSQVATILLLVTFVPILIKVFPAMVSLIGNGTILVMVFFALVGFASGHLLGGPDPDDRTVLALSTATRHPGIAIAIVLANFPDQKLAPAAAILYVLVSAIASKPYLAWAARQHPGALSPASTSAS
jgi:bile acid:Na+ symporter, BASS family